jgi:hypothetical protein
MSDEPTLQVPLPRNVTLEHEADELRIRHRWSSPIHLFLVLFCVVWIGILVSWYQAELGRPHPRDFALWFPLLHVVVGLNLAYATVAGFVNHTLVRAASGELTIRHGPLPWPGGRTIPAREIAQIYREEIVIGDPGDRIRQYRLGVETHDGRRRTLLTCHSADLPRFIEEAVERHLGITDRAVRGEMPK